MRSSARSILAVVNAAYRLDGSAGSWLKGVLRAAQPALDQGYGLCGYLYEITPAGRVQCTQAETVGVVPDGLAAWIQAAAESLPRQQVHLTWAHHLALDTGSAAFVNRVAPGSSWDELALMGPSREMGVRDHLVAKVVDADRAGCLMLAPLARRRGVQRGERARWEQVMAHVMAGFRLRRTPTPRDGDAVVAPDGRLLHAEPGAQNAREALRNAARTIDRARGRDGRLDPDAALEAWRGLVSGRWSLVDRFDSDGRRYLIARRNHPAMRSPTALSDRERQVAAYAALGHTNKRIAYCLGLAPSTISSHLRSAMARLDVRSPAELASFFSAPKMPIE